MTIRLWEKGDTVYGQLVLPLRGGGTLALQVKLTQAQIIQAMKNAGIRFTAQEQAAIGSAFGNIGKFIKKVGKSSILKTLVKTAGKLTGPILTSVVPGAAVALAAANGAMKLVAAARKGNPKAKLALKAATAQADLENKQGKQLPVPSGVAAKGPATAAAFRYLVTVKRAEAA